MEQNGLRHMPLIEPQVANHLHPSNSSATPSLPAKADRFQSTLTDKCYRAAALSVRALNASAMLMAYQAELHEDLTTKPDNEHWDEVGLIADHVLRLHKVAIQASGRAMSLLVLQERARWLSLTNLPTKEKERLLDTPIVPEGLFGAAVASMQKRCEEKKKDDEALKLCLPRKVQPPAAAAPRRSFVQAAPQPAATFRIPKVSNPQQGSQAPKGKTPWPKKQPPGSGSVPAPQPPPPQTTSARKKRTA